MNKFLKISENVFYTLGAIGLMDMCCNAFTNGETRLIRSFLDLIF